MAKILDMPKLSPTMEEGQIGSWAKKEGDPVAVDDLLAEVETDKATMEFRSFDQGTLLKILAPAGSIVKLGQPVAILGQAGEDVSMLLAKAGAAPPPAQAAPPVPATAPTSGAAPSVATTQAIPAPLVAAPSDLSADGRVKASPYVRKLARERGLALGQVAGTGPNGRIVARDLEGVGATQVARPVGITAGALAPPVAHPLSMMRKTIARRLTESKQTVPHFYLTIDVDAGSLTELRSTLTSIDTSGRVAICS